MYKHMADSIKESSNRMFISSEEKTKFNNYENTMRRKDDSYSKEEVDNKVNQIKNKLYESVECSHKSIDNTLDGYLKDVEILGNTVQDANNLADIRSVGDKVEGQELYEIPVLSRGKNLLDFPSDFSKFIPYNGNYSEKILHLEVKEETSYTISGEYFKSNNQDWNSGMEICLFKTLPKNTDSWRLVQDRYTIKFEELAKSVFKYTFTVPQGYKYLAIYFGTATNKSCETTHNLKNIQLEEGTQATPYEPYVEDKLTILSPVQLEKVGDVADRIVCKDGVWGVEKNIVTYHLKDYAHSDYNAFACRTVLPVPSNVDVIWKSADFYSNLAYTHTHIDSQWNNRNVNSIALNNINSLATCDITSENYVYADVVKMIEDNDIWVKFVTKTPQFIPLPHDQQVKLRTFANKTNISFGCEIEGTIKAQVPKSLGATVNTHTEQINNLNKELDRVKKLEENTVSTVTTESYFTTVEATSNGYFEDVKLEGKTLVNVLRLGGNWFEEKTTLQTDSTNAVGLSNYQKSRDLSLLKNNTVYTVVPFVDYTVIKKGILYLQLNTEINGTSNALFRITEDMFNKPTLITTKEFTNKNNNSLFIGGANCEYKFKNVKILVLEGDHTQNPPSYFEGLKSVSDGVDEISVKSVKGDGNLVEYIELNGVNGVSGEDFTDNKYVRTNYITVEPNQMYYIKPSTNVLYDTYVVYFYDSNKSYLGYMGGLTTEFTTVTNTKFIRLDLKKADGTGNTQEDVNNCDFVVSKYRVSEYIPHQSDKKRLLYYNEETQAWEKPILREWDSIEKHDNGKYYYHQRSGEVVLNGSENWDLIRQDTNTSLFSMTKLSNMKYVDENTIYLISDKFTGVIGGNWYLDSEMMYLNAHHLQLRINKTKLSTQDVQGFKQWLQANNVTLVYQLAQEKVYECTNIDLITYANETNYIVDCGAIAPKSTLKVHNNISNVVNLLQKKVSLLESNQSEYQIVQNRILLNSKYTADRGEFRIDIINETYSIEMIDDIDLDTFYLTKAVIDSGKENYDRCVMEEIIDFYTMIGKFSFEMADELFDLLYADESYIEE